MVVHRQQNRVAFAFNTSEIGRRVFVGEPMEVCRILNCVVELPIPVGEPLLFYIEFFIHGEISSRFQAKLMLFWIPNIVIAMSPPHHEISCSTPIFFF